jgi:outer membrane protein assembly factor BamB
VAINPSTGKQLWRKEGLAAYIPSGILYQGRYFEVNDSAHSGLVTCFDPRTGDVVYTGQLRGPYTASPVAGDGKIYFSNENGVVTVIDGSSASLKVLADNDFKERLLASPAISNGLLFFRTYQALYAVGAPAHAAEGR